MSAASLTGPPLRIFLLRIEGDAVRVRHARSAIQALGAQIEEFHSREALLSGMQEAISDGYPPSAVLVDESNAPYSRSSEMFPHIKHRIPVIGLAGQDSEIRERIKSALELRSPKTSLAKCPSTVLEPKVVSSDHLRSILDNAQEAILATDISGRVLSFNRAAEELFGKSSAEAMAMRVEDLAGHAWRSGARGALAQLRDLAHFNVELELRNATNSIVEASFSRVIDQRGDWNTISVIVRDVTERKRAEEALRQSERLATAGRMAATIAHELNNPLEGLKNLLFLLNRHPGLDPQAKSYVEMADREVDRMSFVTRQTLGFYRGSATPVSVDLCRLVDELLEFYRHKFEKLKMNIKRDYDACNKILAFPTELRQVISNLVMNAADATGPGGTITIRLHETPNWAEASGRGLRLIIADNGSGIPASVRPTLFRPFFTTKGEKGTGLGLWVSRGIIKKHGGRIGLRSSTTPGSSGTCFHIFLPYR